MSSRSKQKLTHQVELWEKSVTLEVMPKAGGQHRLLRVLRAARKALSS